MLSEVHSGHGLLKLMISNALLDYARICCIASSVAASSHGQCGMPTAATSFSTSVVPCKATCYGLGISGMLLELSTV